MPYTFSLCYTSRRPHEIRRVIELWKSRATHPDQVEFVVTVDADDEKGIEVIDSLDLPHVSTAIQRERPFCCVKGWNLAAELSTGDVLIALSDDWDPPAGWDKLLTDFGNGSWIREDKCLFVSDGYLNQLCTLPVVSRPRYEKFGYLYYPKYHSMFCDTELTQRAKMDGALLDARHITFQHVHCDAGLRGRDEVDLNHSSSEHYTTGELLYNFRRARGFPIDAGPKAEVYLAETKALGEKYACYMQVIKDDFCLYETCKRLVDEGVSHFFFCIPDAYWDGRPTPESDIKEVMQVKDELNKLDGCVVKSRVFNVEKYRHLPNRLATETCVRNESKDWISGEGFKHILIIDGDELWMPGLLRKVDTIVKHYHPAAISCAMVPVVGVPGYPIHDAKDLATVYVRGDARFAECRAVFGVCRNIDAHDVIHFTATRKTSEEVVTKMRVSGHYDDPAYAFEDFIANTLPNVKEGMKDVHMYRGYQVWPSIRVWTPREWDAIPESLRPYLTDKVKPLGQAAVNPVGALTNSTTKSSATAHLSVPESLSRPPKVNVPRPSPYAPAPSADELVGGGGGGGGKPSFRPVPNTPPPVPKAPVPLRAGRRRYVRSDERSNGPGFNPNKPPKANPPRNSGPRTTY